MATTLLELRTKLREEIKIDPSGDIFDDNQLDDYINQAYFRFQKDGNFQWSENEKTTSPNITVVAGTQEYDKPTDLVKTQLVRFNGETLKLTDKLKIKSTEQTFTSGKTGFYYLRGNKIGLYPIPTSGGELEIDYLGSLDRLSEDSDEIAFTQQNVQVLLKYAAYLVWSNPRGDEGTAASKLADYQNELSTLISAYIYDTSNLSFNVER